MKMKITVEIENADGLKEIKPIVIDTEIPAELATEEYLTELSKKSYYKSRRTRRSNRQGR